MGLDYDTQYAWQVVARNVIGVGVGPVWGFTTQGAPALTISGHVHGSDDRGLSEVMLTGFLEPVTTGDRGHCIVSVPDGWSGTVIADHPVYSIEPPSRSYSNLLSNFEDQDYAVGDRDRYGWADDRDAFPDDATEWLDTDGDSVGNNTDPDDDNDGIPDGKDSLPHQPDITLVEGLNLITPPVLDGDAWGSPSCGRLLGWLQNSLGTATVELQRFDPHPMSCRMPVNSANRISRV